MNYADADFDTSAETDDILCDITVTGKKNMNDWSDYTISTSGNLNTAAGVALSGGYIYNALASGNLDAVENESGTFDVCLSHPTSSG